MKRKSIIFYSIMMVVALLNTTAYWSIRPIWFFINKEFGSLLGMNILWSLCIWLLLLAFSTYTISLLIIAVRKSETNFKRIKKINLLLPVLLGIIFSGFHLYLYNMLKSEKHIAIRNLILLLPRALIIGLIIFFIIFFPIMKISRSAKVRCLIAGLFTVIALIYFLDLGNVKITSGPYFQYIDDNNYAVIWTTNKKSTGWIEYGPNEEHLSKIFSSDKGLIHANSKVHKVILSTTLENDTVFRVGSTNIKNYYQNNIEYGNTVYSDFIKYEAIKDKDDVTFYVLSDIHERKEIYKKFLTKNNYDFLVLNGDTLSSIDSEDIIINGMLKPLSRHTDGFKPFYFIRGNHETRGASSRELPNYLALPNDNYYYTFSCGSIFAVVLDSAEDKLDSHEEYSGLADFEEYRKMETQWLKEVAESDAYKNAKFKIAFSHVPLNSYETLEDDSPLKSYEKDWIMILNSMEIDALFSGHTHDSEFIEADGDIYKFPMIIGGGHSGDGESYVGIKVEVKEDKMNAVLIDEDGQIVGEYIISK